MEYSVEKNKYFRNRQQTYNNSENGKSFTRGTRMACKICLETMLER